MSLMPIGHEFRMHDQEDDDFGDAQLKNIKNKNMANHTSDWYEKILQIEREQGNYAGKGSRLDGAKLSAPSQPTPPKPPQACCGKCETKAPSTDFGYLQEVASKILKQIVEKQGSNYELAFEVASETEKEAVGVVVLLDAILDSKEVTIEYLRKYFPQELLVAAAILQTPEDPTAVNLYLARIKTNPLARAAALETFSKLLDQDLMDYNTVALLTMQRAELTS